MKMTNRDEEFYILFTYLYLNCIVLINHLNDSDTQCTDIRINRN